MKRNRHKILAAKIQIPDIQKDFQSREVLLKELEKAQEKLLILNATIGYGKTVLMSQYVQKSGYMCAWYHLDILDNEISTFVQYLVLSLQQALGDFVFEVDQYPLGQDAAISQMIRELVMELTEYLEGMPDKKLILVLDDFQVLNNPEIFLLLEEMLNHTTSQMRIMLATKSTIPDFLTKYVMRGHGKVIDFQKMSFQKEEVYGLLASLLSKEEANQYTEMIWGNMEGWPAGVMLATLYLKQMANMGQQVEWVHISTESMVQNYIAYELFKTLPYEIQNFLLKTSFAAQLQPELCNYICGITNAEGILKYLLQENLFLLHVGEKRGSYRYHSIFRKFLNDQAGEKIQKEVCGKLAEYYMKRQELEVAAQYAIEAGEAEPLLVVVEKVGLSMLREGKSKSVEEYLRKMVESGVELTPPAWYVMAVCCFEREENEKALEALDAACKGDSAYLAYRKLYTGIMLKREGKEAEGIALIRECCQQLQKKKWKLPPLPEEELNYVERVWKEESETEGKQKLLSVSCFGKFQVKILPDGREISWRTRKAMELFAYLVNLDGKPVERKVLLEQLWPEEQPNNAVAMLHNMIYSIRKELSVRTGLEELIQYRNRQYYLDMSLIETDLENVEKICSLAEQSEIAALLEYQSQIVNFPGVFLEEIDGPWCVARRTYFERSYGKACRLLAEDCEKRKDYEAAVSLWQAYLNVDRYAEEAIKGLLRVYGKLGERTQMNKFFVSVQKIFREELGIALGSDIVKIYEEGIGKKR